jgi:phospholipid/cholesterol/gamma-HCH transport system permease protein
VADLLAIAVIREMAPMMTAILLAGRSGSSITSEIGTMRVTEEVDALRVMGIHPLRYVMVPMFIGGSLVMPFLVAIAMIASALGGLITAVTVLNVSALGFLDRLVGAISGFEVFTTFLKAEVFMWAIISIGCHYGMQVRGGSQEIGRSTTASVVASIFSVILVDVLFSLIALR